MVRLGGLVAAGGLTLALLVNWVPLALVGFGLVGAGFSVIFPLTISAAGRTSKQVSGTAIATVATCGYVGFLVGPAIIGFAADALTLRVALGVVVLLSLCAAAFAHTVDSGTQTVNDETLTHN
jgi:MFS family permease